MLSILKQIRLLFFILLFVVDPALAAAEDTETEDTRAYWDYGAGFGAVRFEHYPASDETRTVALPFPTFQYRGKILRADDRDGAHLYLFKSEKVTVEFSGQGSPALDSSSNKARQGMEDLPWMLALGPQLVYRPGNDFVMSFGVYQAATFENFNAKFSGNIFEARAAYNQSRSVPAWSFFEAGSMSSKWILSLKAGSKELNSLYFEVSPMHANSERAAYQAKAGLMNQNLSYYQSYRSGRGAIYVGGGLHSYALSANRASPLHKSDYSFVALLGFSYTLGESHSKAVPEDETSSVIERLRRNRQLQQGI